LRASTRRDAARVERLDNLTPRNRLLRALTDIDRRAVLDRAELIEISVGSIIQETRSVPAYAYFPESGLGSIVAVMEDGTMVEAASVGIDGFIGATLFLGTARSSSRVIWQVPGEAYRIPATDFVGLIHDGRFGSTLAGYMQQMIDQMTQVAGCNRRHTIERRAARWLLMTHDRGDGDRFLLTHEFLATMLGAGRPKVSLAAQKLQAAGLISYRRGLVTILDRAGLERAACECYAVVARAFPAIDRRREVAGKGQAAS
jgi:CRP-like cAMP-binding protein